MGISNDIRPTHPVHHEVPKKEPVKPKDEEDLPAKKRIRDSEPERTLEPEQIVELNQPNREPEKRDAFFDENTQEPADDTAPKDLPKWLSYLILWLIAGVLLVILIVINWNTIDSLWQKNGTTGTTSSTTETTSSTTTTTTTTSGTSDISTGSIVAPTGTTATTGTSAASSGATATAKSAIRINLLNGSGVTGAANTTKTTLQTAGYTIAHVGNAKSFNYTASMIYYHSGKAAEAAQVKAALPALSITIELNDTVTATTYDLVVVVGKK